MAMVETIVVPAPAVFDGWHLAIALDGIISMNCHGRLSYRVDQTVNPEVRELIIDVTGFSQAQKDMIPAAVSGYTDPPDTSKVLSAVIMA